MAADLITPVAADLNELLHLGSSREARMLLERLIALRDAGEDGVAIMVRLNRAPAAKDPGTTMKGSPSFDAVRMMDVRFRRVEARLAALEAGARG